MSRKGKLAERLKARPTDFTFDELTTLMSRLGYELSNAGHSSGSRVAFVNDDGDFIRLHKPHPRNILKPYQIDDIITALSERGVL